MNNLQEKITALVGRIGQQLAELDELSGFPMPHTLGPPAKPEQIAEVERRRGIELPEDYKAFLTLHNGWAGFNGDSALLSTAEMMAGPIHDGHRELQGELVRVGQLAPGQGVIFEGSLGTQISYFDVLGKKTTGNLDAVLWSTGEVARYPSFTEFLEGYVKELDKMIVKERENLR